MFALRLYPEGRKGWRERKGDRKEEGRREEGRMEDGRKKENDIHVSEDDVSNVMREQWRKKSTKS